MATDSFGNATSLDTNFIYDGTPPALTFDLPGLPYIQGYTFAADSLSVEAAITASDALTGLAGVPSLTVQGTSDSFPLTAVPAEAGTWQATMTLAEGSYVLSAAVADAAGNETTVNLPLVVDVTAPIITPPAGPLYASTSIDVTFSYSDAGSGVNAASASLLLDGTTPIAPNYLYPSYAFYVVDVTGVPEGTHTLTENVNDYAGNAAVPASVTLIVDHTAPTASITLDDGRGYHSGAAISSTVNMRVALSDTYSPPDMSSLTVYYNHIQYSPVAVVGDVAEYDDVVLFEGDNDFEIGADNLAGDSLFAVVDVVLDLPPVLSVSLPDLTNPPYWGDVGLPLTGTAEDLTTMTLTFAVAGGGTVEIDDFTTGSFQQVVQLLEGPDTVTVTATNASGGQTTEMVSATLWTAPPVVAFVSPRDGDSLQTISAPVTVSVCSPFDISLVTVNGTAASSTGAGQYTGNIYVLLQTADADGDRPPFSITANATDDFGHVGTAVIGCVVAPPAGGYVSGSLTGNCIPDAPASFF